MSLEYRVGDVFDELAKIPDGSIDLIVSSPPFLALRSYLPADHPDKHREIGSEPTPAAFIDTHLALAAEYARVLAPHGSLCYEIGDTYSGSGGAGGDYGEGGLRDGQQKFSGSAARSDSRKGYGGAADRKDNAARPGTRSTGKCGPEWPLAKSMCIIPHLFAASLAYGRNLLTGDESPAGSWRIRNVICWARPNPPVGALGDKFRPATSYITVACKSAKRYFDLDAVRTEHTEPARTFEQGQRETLQPHRVGKSIEQNPAGAPPLDWHTDEHPEDGDWLWRLPTQPYKGAHFATYPMALPKRLIESMCPQRVCTVCGKPSERIVGEATYVNNAGRPARMDMNQARKAEAAQALGRHGIGIDLDSRNADLARDRVGMFLEIVA